MEPRQPAPVALPVTRPPKETDSMWALRNVGIAILSIVLLSLADAQDRFPEWKVLPIGLDVLWSRAPTIVVGDMQNLHSLGVQEVQGLPWPAASVRRIYWCEATLVTHYVIRGTRPSRDKQYVWGSGFPGCQIASQHYSSSRKQLVTRLWFICEDKRYIRPVNDMLLSYMFYGTWDDHTDLDPTTQFALLLLNPEANGETTEQFAKGLFASASIACSLLSQTYCIERLQTLASQANRGVRDAACDFLLSQFRQRCKP